MASSIRRPPPRGDESVLESFPPGTNMYATWADPLPPTPGDQGLPFPGFPVSSPIFPSSGRTFSDFSANLTSSSTHSRHQRISNPIWLPYPRSPAPSPGPKPWKFQCFLHLPPFPPSSLQHRPRRLHAPPRALLEASGIVQDPSKAALEASKIAPRRELIAKVLSEEGQKPLVAKGFLQFSSFTLFAVDFFFEFLLYYSLPRR